MPVIAMPRGWITINKTNYHSLETHNINYIPLFHFPIFHPHITNIIFPRNASFREYYVFVLAAAAALFRCQRDNFWRIFTTFFKVDTCIAHPNISDEFDTWYCRPIQNGCRRPFIQNNPKKSSVSTWNDQKCDQSDFRTSKMAAAAILSNISTIKKFRIDLKWPEMRS